MEIVAIMLFLLLLSAVTHINHASKALFNYVKHNHSDTWVSLGSPRGAPGIFSGNKDPAFSFVFEDGYKTLDDDTVSTMCSRINTNAKRYAVAISTCIVGALVYGTVGI